ncbi:hypothetical protein nbrc107696_43080 [Gordonia spumicola]|uniref:AMP-binding enzyme C-terminal domain-containing protein n=1 Tax=Gordonia spumicola TaxID=589161 RepID=A0A7I9VF84_9ACTN|nr:hypothetical protein [Gordonia spumicola]GEE03862.1 hypothetical protein nbrc107696_43080 [Gordonia spumicola]
MQPERSWREVDGYKIPECIVVDELPKPSTGKIQKNLVRDAHTDLYD